MVPAQVSIGNSYKIPQFIVKLLTFSIPKGRRSREQLTRRTMTEYERSMRKM